MENKELIKRYIYAVVSHLPQKSQVDVEKELESIISDMLDSRCGENTPTEVDVKAVLTELGSPTALAVKYCGDEGKSLISGVYFLWWKRVFKIVVPIIATICAFAATIAALVNLVPTTSDSGFVSNFIAGFVTGGIEGALQSAFVITLVFAVLERSNANITSKDFLGNLQSVPPQKAQIKLYEPISNIFWNILVAIIFLGFPYLFGGYSDETGWIAALDIEHIRSVWYLVVLWAAIGICKELFKLYERRYSLRFAIVTAVANLLIGISAGFFLLNPSIVSPSFADKLSIIFEDNAEVTRLLASNVCTILFGIVVFALLLETGTTLYRALRYDCK